MTTHLLLCLTLFAAMCTGCQAARAGEPYEGFGTLTTMFAAPQREADWPAGTLTGAGFDLDPDASGKSPGMRAILLVEGNKNVGAISTQLQPGRRAWVKGEVYEKFIRVDEVEVIPFKKAADIPDRAINAIGRFTITELGAWHNRMPPSIDRRHLVVTIRAESAAGEKKDRTIKVERVFYSFDEDREGVVAEQMSLIDPNTGMASGKMEMLLPFDKPTDVALRGEQTYPDSHVNDEIYVIVVLSVGAERIVLRQHCRVIAAV